MFNLQLAENPIQQHVLPLTLGAVLLIAITPWQHSQAATAVIDVSADTSLMAQFPEINCGHTQPIQAGSSSAVNTSRILMKFSPSAVLPAGAVVTGASLQVGVVRADESDRVDSTFELRRVLVSWNEGVQTGLNGAAASPGESTWIWRSSGTEKWRVPGGEIGSDYSSVPSGTCFIMGVNSYTFASTPQMVQDVQAWLDNPAENFGWVLMSRSEGVTKTARRFASRELTPARLTIDYEVPVTKALITTARAGNGSFEIEWSGGQPPYQVQAAGSLSGEWQNVGGPISDHQATFPFASESRFFRVISASTP